VATELSHVTAINAASAAFVFQSVPELLIDQPMSVSESDRCIDVEFLVDVSVAEGHATKVDRKVCLSIDDSSGKSRDVDTTI